MSEEFLNKVSLKYLINNSQKQKLENSEMEKSKLRQFKKDKKFYKNRIIDLLKNNFSTNLNQGLPTEINELVDNLFEQIITYFKNIDKVEMIQNKYIDIEGTKGLEVEKEGEGEEEDNSEVLKEINQICIKKKMINMAHFIERKKTKEEIHEYPQKKKYKLKTPELKNKGIIGKKKNIVNNYEGENQENGT